MFSSCGRSTGATRKRLLNRKNEIAKTIRIVNEHFNFGNQASHCNGQAFQLYSVFRSRHESIAAIVTGSLFNLLNVSLRVAMMVAKWSEGCLVLWEHRHKRLRIAEPAKGECLRSQREFRVGRAAGKESVKGLKFQELRLGPEDTSIRIYHPDVVGEIFDRDRKFRPRQNDYIRSNQIFNWLTQPSGGKHLAKPQGNRRIDADNVEVAFRSAMLKRIIEHKRRHLKL